MGKRTYLLAPALTILVWSGRVILMKTLTISEGKAQLSALVERVVSTGQPVTLGRAGKPMVQLVPYKPTVKGKRWGAFKNRIRLAGDFDSWGPEEARALGLEG